MKGDDMVRGYDECEDDELEDEQPKSVNHRIRDSYHRGRREATNDVRNSRNQAQHDEQMKWYAQCRRHHKKAMDTMLLGDCYYISMPVLIFCFGIYLLFKL